MEKPAVTRIYQLIEEKYDVKKIAEIIDDEFNERRNGKLGELILPAVKEIVRHKLIQKRKKCPACKKLLDN